MVRVARAPELLATKAEAFADRGEGDFVASKDIEDFVTVVNGRAELVDELTAAPREVRAYLAEAVTSWLNNDDFIEAIPGHLYGDEASQQRVSLVLARFRAIAGNSSNA